MGGESGGVPGELGENRVGRFLVLQRASYGARGFVK